MPTPLLLVVTCLVFLLGLLALGVHGREAERGKLLRRVLGFALLGVTIFGFSLLRPQLDDDAAIGVLGFLLVLTVALWASGHWVFAATPHPVWRRALAATVVGAFALGSGATMLDLSPPTPEAVAVGDVSTLPKAPCTPVKVASSVADTHIAWTPYDPDVVQAWLAVGRPVFVDVTADWCPTCKTNERLILETEAVRDELSRTGILAVKADFTDEDPRITELLTEIGRSGLPVYVVMTPDGGREVLPTMLDVTTVSSHLRVAGRAHPPQSFRTPCPVGNEGRAG